MAIGSKEKYSAKQKRKAEHIETSYEEQGVPKKKAEEIAWATVNKQSGGGELSGSGKDTPKREKQQARKDSARNAVTTKQEKSKADSLEKQSKTELLNKAREMNVRGRTQMNKQELILALRRS